MTDLQKRLLVCMTNYLQDFRQGKLSLTKMVGELEGALDAGEFSENDFIISWYDHWTPLEIFNATSENGGKDIPLECLKAVDRFEAFLLTYIKTESVD